MKSPCSQGIRKVFCSSFLTERKKGFIVMRTGKAQDLNPFEGYNPHSPCMAGYHQLKLTTYLGWLIGDQHTLPPSDGVFYILGMAVPFHSDQVAGRCNLPCKGKEGKKPRSLLQWSKVMHRVERYAIKGDARGPRGPSEHTQVPASPWKHPFPKSLLPDTKGNTGFLKLTLGICG